MIRFLFNKVYITLFLVFCGGPSLGFAKDSGSVFKKEIFLSDFLRNADGSIRTLTQDQAINECDKKGMRLPLPRELAQDSIKYGLVILEEPEYRAGKFPPGFSQQDFYRVDTPLGPWPYKKIDYFYYSNKSYKAPSGDLDKYPSWTSSSFPNRGELGYFFRGDTCSFRLDYVYVGFAARCIQ